MCGIAGLWQFERFNESDAILKQMLSSIVHRGPDDEGIWQSASKEVLLGQRRLAIIDLSPGGHQPMLSDDGQVAITFNGEIYNYLELRKDLERAGIRFHSQSDTEVLLKGYQHWGTKVLSKLVGMFAFAIWDAKEHYLFLARDRAGEKPLYYTHSPKGFGFASELQALKALPWFAPKINRDAVAFYLMLKNVPAPHTIFDDVFKLPPAHAMIVAGSQIKMWCYWDALSIVQEPRLEISDEDAQEQLETLMRQAVKGQMISDVPLGAFLSGGIDSSLVVSFMSELSSRRVKTFTIGFNAPNDEAPHAKALANYMQTDHTEEYMTDKDVLDLIPLIPGMFAEPFADPTALANYLVAKVARKYVTVCLSGDGGDEAFGGYTSWHDNFERMKRLYFHLPVMATLRPLTKRLPKRFGRAGLLLGRSKKDIFLSFISFFVLDEIDALVGTRPRLAAYERAWQIKSLTDHRQSLTSAFLTFLPDAILTKVDRSAMAVSLESRAPLLDYRILEFSLRLPEPHVRRKQLLKDVLFKRIPKSMLDRPKQGFEILPLAKWLRHELREPLTQALSDDRLGSLGVRSKYAHQLLDEHVTGKRNHEKRLWALWMLSAWSETIM